MCSGFSPTPARGGIGPFDRAAAGRSMATAPGLKPEARRESSGSGLPLRPSGSSMVVQVPLGTSFQELP